jgi:Spy/CpxP family protein refolding chaperone
MPKAKDEPKSSTGPELDRRAVIKAALVVGGVSALGVGAAAAAMPQGAFVGEREWARALARHIANQLPEAARQIPDLCLTPDQLQQLRRVFENTLITNMGCENPPG